MTVYVLFKYSDNIYFRGVFQTKIEAYNAIADYYVHSMKEGEIDSDFEYKDTVYQALDLGDKEMINFLSTKYYKWVLNRLNCDICSFDYEVKEIEVNKWYD